MRENLFRGRSLETGEWVEGNLVRMSDEEYGESVAIVPINVESYRFTMNGIYVDPTYIHQYTGYNYPDGRKIFEGDLVKDIFYDDYGEIVWDKGGFCVKFDDLCVYLDGLHVSIEHFGIVCDPPAELNKEWSEENEHIN